MNKWLCEECNKTCAEDLKRPHPFIKGIILSFCPHCLEVQSLIMKCDEVGCLLPARIGAPTDSGYRSTCSNHQPRPLINS